MWKKGSLELAVAAVFFSAWFATTWCGPAFGQATRPASAQALPALIQAVREANTLDAAATAFASGCNLNRRDVELNRAYLARVIRLGRPELSSVPATNLLEAGAADGLAYWALAYCNGRRTDYGGALTWTIKAAATLKDSNDLQYQLGQLAAWCEGTHPPQTGADANALARLRDELSERPAYAAGHRLMKEVCDRLAELAALRKQVSQTENDGRVEERLALAAKAAVDRLNGQVAALESKIKRIGRAWNDPEADTTYLQEELDGANSQLADTNAKIASTRAEMQRHVDATLSLKRSLDELQAQLRKFKVPNLPESFRWTVPTVETPRR